MKKEAILSLLLASSLHAGTFESDREKCDTPVKVYFWMMKNITYKHDQRIEDDFLPAREVYRRKEDDCDGYAVLAYDWLKYHNYESKVIVMVDGKYFHAVCVVKENGGWSSVGNDGYWDGYKSIDDILHDWAFDKNSYWFEVRT